MAMAKAEPKADMRLASSLDGATLDSPISELDLEKTERLHEYNGMTAGATIAAPTTSSGQLPNSEDANHDSNLTTVRTAADWEGPNDPENPHNWALGKKIWHGAAPAFCGFTVTIASSMITPASKDLQRYFGVSQTTSLLPLTLYVLGLGFGPIVAAGPSETYGRAVVYKYGLLLFMLFTLGVGFSSTWAGVLGCRFMAGFSGGGMIAVGTGSLTDLWPPRDRALSQAGFIMAPFLGPALGPVIGGFVAQYKSWEWTQWCTLFIAVPVYLFVLPTSETYKKIILQRRAKRLGLPPPPSLLPTKLWPRTKFLLTVTLFRPIHMLLTEPIVGLYSLYTAFNFAILFALFAAYPYVFQGVYRFNLWQYGLTFLGIGIGVLVAVGTSALVDRMIYQKLHRRALEEGKTVVAPEHRLYTAMIGSFGVPIGLFWFGWTAKSDIHWIVPVLAGIPFAWGNLCVFLSCMLYLSDVYGPLNGASASAANGVLRYTLGAVFPLFTIPMYKNLGIGWATSLLGFISVVLLLIPWVFYRWGPSIRAKSHYDIIRA